MAAQWSCLNHLMADCARLVIGPSWYLRSMPTVAMQETQPFSQNWGLTASSPDLSSLAAGRNCYGSKSPMILVANFSCGKKWSSLVTQQLFCVCSHLNRPWELAGFPWMLKKPFDLVCCDVCSDGVIAATVVQSTSHRKPYNSLLREASPPILQVGDA